MSTDKGDLEHIEPGTAQELFLDHRATDCTDSTVRNHRYRLNPFVRWCGDVPEVDSGEVRLCPGEFTGGIDDWLWW